MTSYFIQICFIVLKDGNDHGKAKFIGCGGSYFIYM